MGAFFHARFSRARHIIYIGHEKVEKSRERINGSLFEKIKKVKKIKKTFQKRLTLSFVNGIMFKLSFKESTF